MPALTSALSPRDALQALNSHVLETLNLPQGTQDIVDYGLSTDLPSSVMALSKRYMQINKIYTPHETKVIQIVGVATAAVSVVASLITTCWFCRMRKRLRHK